MGNRRAREFMLQRDRIAEWERTQTEPRSAGFDFSPPGLGFLRLQLVVCPSFEEARAWEIRQQIDKKWQLFGSSVQPDLRLLGYNAIAFESEQLGRFLHDVTSLTLPILPDLSGHGGADGTVFELSLFGDLYSECRFRWWSDPPSQWRPLVDVANRMIVAFSTAEGRPFDPFDD